MKELVKTFKALSDESRLRVLELILERESCVCEVVQALEIPQSSASRILGILYNAGFLKVRKVGLWSLYSIDWRGMPPYLKDILNVTREAFEEKRRMNADRDNLHKNGRFEPACSTGSRKPEME